jgi:CubicO group peptidase (beta-lactamase class C family)
MEGFPPPEELLVTNENKNQPEFTVWTNQHTRELRATQRIWRGKGPISTFARPQHPQKVNAFFDSMVIPDRQGLPITVKQVLRQNKVVAFLAMKLDPSGMAVILNEQYFNGMRPENVYNLFSAVKPMQGALVGIAVAEGLLDLNGKIQDIIPELSGSAYHDVTLRQVTQMESGIKYSFGVEWVDGRLVNVPGKSEHQLAGESIERSDDRSVPKGYYEFIKTVQREHPPGNVFNYNNVDVHVATWAVQKAFRKRFADTFSERIFQRLRPEEDAQIGCDWVGNPVGGLCISLRDWARWGEMVLLKGVFRGQPILDRSFFEEIGRGDPKRIDNSRLVAAGHIPRGTRGAYFFLQSPDGTYPQGGAGGQCLLIDPPRRHVIAVFAGQHIGGGDAELARNVAHAVKQISEAMEQVDVT